MRRIATSVLICLAAARPALAHAEEASAAAVVSAASAGSEASPSNEAAPSAKAEDSAAAPSAPASATETPPSARAVETITATSADPVRSSPGPIGAPPTLAPSAPADDGFSATRDDPDKADDAEAFRWAIHGFLRAGYSYVQDDPGSFLVGQHSGFRLYNTRVNLVGGWGEHLAFDLSLDTDQQLDGATNQAFLRPALRDANLQFDYAGVTLTVGQFKAPFNGEFLLSDGDVPFARRSFLSDGIVADEGQRTYRLIGLDRQLGAMLTYVLPIGAAAARFDIAAVNGNGLNQGRNDNKAVAGVARASIGWNGSQLGLGGYINQRTEGTLATLVDETDLAADVDVLLNIYGVKLFGMFILENTSYETTAADAKLQWGTVASVSRSFDLGPVAVEPAYRFAIWEPLPQGQLADAGLMDHTVGVNVYPAGAPFRVQLNYTARLERAARSAPNDLFEGVVQANF